MRFIVIGISDSHQPFFPPDVLQIIRRGKLFSGGKRHHEIVAPLLPADAEWTDITVPLDSVFSKYRLAEKSHPDEDTTMTVFASGDPLFFGFANTLRQRMPEAEVTLYPAFNSLQTLAHRLCMPYHDMRIVSLTGRPWHELDRALIERSPKIGILTDREHTPAAIAQRMTEYGYTYYNMYVGERLGNKTTERVTRMKLTDAVESSFGQPNCVIVEQTGPQQPAAAAFGIADSDFALLHGRAKMITKMPIRLLTLQALDLPRRRVLWDIGFCTGSVSIEARLRFPHVQVWAFEVRPECKAIIEQNARHMHAPGINTVIGDFLCADTDTLPRPDAVFIGGHGGKLKEIMAKVAGAMDSGGVMVMNSVTSHVVTQLTDRKSSHELWNEACRELRLRQSSPLHVVIDDNNPVDILKAEK